MAKTTTKSARSVSVKSTKKRTAKAPRVKVEHRGLHSTRLDFFSSIFIVSLIMNLFFVVAILILQLTNEYDSAVVDLLIN